jgi:phosphoglycerate dehydrogenase-like enzyme
MAVSLILALVKKVVSADKAVRVGEWTRKYDDLIGSELMGKTVGIVGLGRIGTEVARRLKSFKVQLLYWSRTRKEDLEAEIGLEYAGLEEILDRSDIITLHLPHTSETHGLISGREFCTMKDGVQIVNTARGGIIDNAALVVALRSGKVAGAAIDVFDSEPIDPDDPLISMDNVILTPHISASSREAMERMALQVAEDVLRTLRGEIPRNTVIA